MVEMNINGEVYVKKEYVKSIAADEFLQEMSDYVFLSYIKKEVERRLNKDYSYYDVSDLMKEVHSEVKNMVQILLIMDL